MVFSKTFPRNFEGQTTWEEVFLTPKEERYQEQLSRREHMVHLRQCLADAQQIVEEESMRKFQSDVVRLALDLFEKRASHTHFYKLEKCKEKFQKLMGYCPEVIA